MKTDFLNTVLTELKGKKNKPCDCELKEQSTQTSSKNIRTQMNRFVHPGGKMKNECGKYTEGSELHQQCIYDIMNKTVEEAYKMVIHESVYKTISSGKDISEDSSMKELIRGVKDLHGIISAYEASKKKKNEDEEDDEDVNEQVAPARRRKTQRQITAKELESLSTDQINQLRQKAPEIFPGYKKPVPEWMTQPKTGMASASITDPTDPDFARAQSHQQGIANAAQAQAALDKPLRDLKRIDPIAGAVATELPYAALAGVAPAVRLVGRGMKAAGRRGVRALDDIPFDQGTVKLGMNFRLPKLSKAKYTVQGNTLVPQNIRAHARVATAAAKRKFVAAGKDVKELVTTVADELVDPARAFIGAGGPVTTAKRFHRLGYFDNLDFSKIAGRGMRGRVTARQRISALKDATKAARKNATIGQIRTGETPTWIGTKARAVVGRPVRNIDPKTGKQIPQQFRPERWRDIPEKLFGGVGGEFARKGLRWARPALVTAGTAEAIGGLALGYEGLTEKIPKVKLRLFPGQKTQDVDFNIRDFSAASRMGRAFTNPDQPGIWGKLKDTTGEAWKQTKRLSKFTTPGVASKMLTGWDPVTGIAKAVKSAADAYGGGEGAWGRASDQIQKSAGETARDVDAAAAAAISGKPKDNTFSRSNAVKMLKDMDITPNEAAIAEVKRQHNKRNGVEND